jgi:hypothetical protein
VPAERAAGHRRLLLVSVGIGLAVTIAGATIVGPSPADEAPAEFVPAGASARLAATPVEGTTTTAQGTISATAATRPSSGDETPRATTATTAPAPTTTTAAAVPAPVPPPVPAPPPAARATADPSLPRYVDQLLPPGVAGSIGGCAWQATAGGRLIATGAVRNGLPSSRSWTVTMHFLQARRELARASTVLPLGAGQSGTWTLTSPLPVPPADLLCSLSVS